MQIKKLDKIERRYDHTAGRSRANKMYNAKMRIYIWPEGETVLENLQNRRSRPTTIYKSIMPDILKQAGIDAGAKVRWSQTAGCQCGCSPGFIVDGWNPDHADIHVTVV